MDTHRYRRFRTLAGVLIGLSGILMLAVQTPLIYLLSDFYYDSRKNLEIVVPILGAFQILLGAGLLILDYLNYGLFNYRLKSRSATSFDDLDEIHRAAAQARLLLDEAKQLSTESKKEQALTEQERKEVTANLEKVLSSSLKDDVLKAFEDKYAETTLNERYNSAIREAFSRCLERLSLETGRLGRRGNINLTLGFITTMLALGVLAQITFFVPLPQNLSNYGELAIRYLPRLALALFIQVFAFFFLRLYKTTLEEIKFFQNENDKYRAGVDFFGDKQQGQGYAAHSGFM